jgi:bifunctional enzyme CysN/CysC/sulfate adenylyltransferase subunit 1
VTVTPGGLKSKIKRIWTDDDYKTNRLTGSFILVEQGSNHTVAAGMLHPANSPFTAEYDDFSI